MTKRRLNITSDIISPHKNSAIGGTTATAASRARRNASAALAAKRAWKHLYIDAASHAEYAHQRKQAFLPTYKVHIVRKQADSRRSVPAAVMRVVVAWLAIICLSLVPHE